MIRPRGRQCVAGVQVKRLRAISVAAAEGVEVDAEGASKHGLHSVAECCDGRADTYFQKLEGLATTGSWSETRLQRQCIVEQCVRMSVWCRGRIRVE